MIKDMEWTEEKKIFFKVQHANTGRFQKSALINMQKLLNDDLQKNKDSSLF